MSYIQDIRSLEHHHVLLGGLFFAATFAPGFLILFHFKPDLVESYDFFKLALFSLSLTLPFVLAHSFLISAIGAADESDEYDHLAAIACACVCSVIILFSSLLIAYLYDATFKIFLLLVAVLTMFACVGYFAAAWKQRKRG